MEPLFIDKTEYTPSIRLDAATHRMEIRGDSFPENTYDFYRPVMQWLKTYFAGNATHEVEIEIALNYFNSSSSQQYFELFDLIEAGVKRGWKVRVAWIYTPQNESVLEAGEDFLEEFPSIKIDLIEK